MAPGTWDNMGSEGTASFSQPRAECKAVEARTPASQGTRKHQAGMMRERGRGQPMTRRGGEKLFPSLCPPPSPLQLDQPGPAPTLLPPPHVPAHVKGPPVSWLKVNPWRDGQCGSCRN